ncbi:MAG: SMC-Scp complex subunit ScpB [Desulfococcaceae bacterium]
MKEELRHIIEALLFVSDTPLSVRRIQEILDLRETFPVREALFELASDYDTRKGGFYLCEVAGGYQLRTRPEYKEWIRRMLQNKPARLSKASLETLAIIAYKQPVIRSDIDYIRGVDSGGVLRILLERKLIRVMGRREIPGRPMIYGTTQKFLEMFDLKDLKDLPSPKEIEAFGKEDPLEAFREKSGEERKFDEFIFTGGRKAEDAEQEQKTLCQKRRGRVLYALLFQRIVAPRCRRAFVRKMKQAKILPRRFRTASLHRTPAGGSRNPLRSKETGRSGKRFLRAFRNARRRSAKTA